MAKLKVCPFCGGKAKFNQAFNGCIPGVSKTVFYSCEQCESISSAITGRCENQEELFALAEKAAAAWNRRADDAELARYKQLFESCWIWETPAEANHIESFTDNCYVRIPAGEFRHALELLKLEADGLLAALPCKVGDTVHCVAHGESILEQTATGFECWNGAWRVRVFNVNKHGYRNDHLVPFEDFGKTVFSTREAAEAALEGAGG